MSMETRDLIIVGTGAAGLSAALYAGRYKMNVLALGDLFGGDTATAGTIWNYPGAPNVDGYELMKIMKKQAEDLGTEFQDGRVREVSQDKDCFLVKTDIKTYHTQTVVLAVGTERRHLGLPNEQELTSKGVHYCITCDGPLYTGKNIAIVGGGDASVKGVNLASEYAKNIYLITMERELNAEPVNLEQMKKLGTRVQILYETKVKEIVGSAKLEKVILSKQYQNSNELSVEALFIEIGAMPDTEIAKKLGVDLDESGYIKTDSMMRTNIPGVYAAGDTVNFFGSFKQDITAAATGAVAATSAYSYKKVHGDVCDKHAIPLEAKLRSIT